MSAGVPGAARPDDMAEHPKADVLARLVGRVVLEAAAHRKPWTAERVRELAEASGLDASDVDTPSGNPIVALSACAQAQGAARSLLVTLLGRALAAEPLGTDEERRALASKLAWLSAHSPVDGLGALALGNLPDVEATWIELARWAIAVDRDEAATEDRPSVLAAVTTMPRVQAAAAAVELLREGLDDARYQALLDSVTVSAAPATTARADEAPTAADREVTSTGGQAAGASPDTEEAGGVASDRRAASDEIQGEVVAGPLSPLTLVIGCVSGVLLVWWLFRLLARLALRVRRPATVRVSSRGIVVDSRLVVLGRTVRSSEIHMPLEGLARAVREVRYPRLAMYVGLLCLAVGSYAGVSLWVDGARAASPSLLGLGAIVFGAGIAMDLVGSVLVPGRSGRTRLLLVPRKGRALAVRTTDGERASDALRRLAVGS